MRDKGIANERSGVVYSLDCNDCSAIYVGKTRRQVVVVDVTTLKMARKPVKIQRKVQQDVLRKVNRIKETR